MGRRSSEKSSRPSRRPPIWSTGSGMRRQTRIQCRVREEFDRWSGVPVREFVPNFASARGSGSVTWTNCLSRWLAGRRRDCCPNCTRIGRVNTLWSLGPGGGSDGSAGGRVHRAFPMLRDQHRHARGAPVTVGQLFRLMAALPDPASEHHLVGHHSGRDRQDSVKIGFISADSSAGPDFEDTAKACQARVDAQNAKGGVNGRKIALATVDDQSSGANLTAAQDLVKNRRVFAVVDNSPFAFLSYRFLLDSGVPTIGGGTTATLRREGQRGPHQRWRERSPPFSGLTYHVADVTKNWRHEVGTVCYGPRRRPPRRRRTSRVHGPGRARARVHQHHGRLRHHGCRSPGARPQERRRRRGVPAAGRQQNLAIQRAQQNDVHDGGARVRLRPGAARPTRRADVSGDVLSQS